MKRSQGSVKMPNSVRAIEIALGVIVLVLAGLVLASPAFAAVLVLLFLSISLLFAGIEGILVGAGGRRLSGGQRAFRLVAGIIAVGLSVAVLAFPAFGLLSSVVLLSLGLLVLGASGVAKGVTDKRMPSWAGALYVGVGVLTVALSVAMIALPMLGLTVLYSLLAVTLIINGAAYIMAGITGVAYMPMGPLFGGNGNKKTWESDAA